MVETLRPVARVVVDQGGVVASAFQTRAFPAVLRVAPDEAGTLRVTDDRVSVGQPAASPPAAVPA